MFHTSVRNPKTGRVNRCRAWAINPRAVVDALKDEKLTARDISWSLLADEEAYQEMVKTAEGEDADSCFALNIFESALDFSLGLGVVRFIHAFLKYRKCMPAPFTVVATRKGDIFCVGKSGTVFDPFKM